jgi:hypothetical protein
MKGRRFEMNDGTYTKAKRFVTFIVGVAVLYASLIFSKNGFEFETSSDYVWVGWVLAFAATSAEFMLNSTFKRINWTIVGLGLCAYAYSIWTNMLGFQSLRPGEDPYSVINILGAVFIDVFPEVAISWALQESKIGDIIGNLIKTAQNPDEVTSQVTNGHGHNNGKSQYKAKHRPVYNMSDFDEDSDDPFPG